MCRSFSARAARYLQRARNYHFDARSTDFAQRATTSEHLANLYKIVDVGFMLSSGTVKEKLALPARCCGIMILHSSKLGNGTVSISGREENPEGKSVVFERGIDAYIMGIDGTWRCECTMDEVSEASAKLTINRSMDGMNLKEFFLVLSSTGLAFRRCQLERVNGNKISATFVSQKLKKKKQSESGQVVLV